MIGPLGNSLIVNKWGFPKVDEDKGWRLDCEARSSRGDVNKARIGCRCPPRLFDGLTSSGYHSKIHPSYGKFPIATGAFVTLGGRVGTYAGEALVGAITPPKRPFREGLRPLAQGPPGHMSDDGAVLSVGRLQRAARGLGRKRRTGPKLVWPQMAEYFAYFPTDWPAGGWTSERWSHRGESVIKAFKVVRRATLNYVGIVVVAVAGLYLHTPLSPSIFTGRHG